MDEAAKQFRRVNGHLYLPPSAPPWTPPLPHRASRMPPDQPRTASQAPRRSGQSPGDSSNRLAGFDAGRRLGWISRPRCGSPGLRRARAPTINGRIAGSSPSVRGGWLAPLGEHRSVLLLDIPRLRADDRPIKRLRRDRDRCLPKPFTGPHRPAASFCSSSEGRSPGYFRRPVVEATRQPGFGRLSSIGGEPRRPTVVSVPAETAWRPSSNGRGSVVRIRKRTSRQLAAAETVVGQADP
jgi:hypothetical protein